MLAVALHAAAGGWELGARTGYGRLALRSDQTGATTHDAWSLAGRAGYRVFSRLSMGLDLGGWLLQPSNTEDPERGESASSALLYFHAYPFERVPLYLRLAAGRGSYTNNSQQGHGGAGWGAWAVGAGCEVAVSERLALVPQFQYAGSPLSGVPASVGARTGRRYDVLDFSVGLLWRPAPKS